MRKVHEEVCQGGGDTVYVLTVEWNIHLSDTQREWFLLHDSNATKLQLLSNTSQQLTRAKVYTS